MSHAAGPEQRAKCHCAKRTGNGTAAPRYTCGLRAFSYSANAPAIWRIIFRVGSSLAVRSYPCRALGQQDAKGSECDENDEVIEVWKGAVAPHGRRNRL